MSPALKKMAFIATVALLVAGSATAAVRLTGYAATSRSWAAHHTPDPDPKLAKGCCYLPKQADGTDRYYEVQRQSGRVFLYSMHFAPRISARLASVLLRRDELPSDARLVRSKRRAECLILEYRSAAAKRAFGTATVGAALYSSVSGRYDGKVEDITISYVVTTALGC